MLADADNILEVMFEGVLILVLLEYARRRSAERNKMLNNPKVLILVLLEYARRPPMDEENWDDYDVLILVLLEYARRLYLLILYFKLNFVLILVLLEYARRPGQKR